MRDWVEIMDTTLRDGEQTSGVSFTGSEKLKMARLLLKVANLLAKGSLKHVEGQLKKTPEQHLADIKKSIHYASDNGISVNLYLETWSNGMIDSREYVYFLMDNLKD